MAGAFAGGAGVGAHFVANEAKNHDHKRAGETSGSYWVLILLLLLPTTTITIVIAAANNITSHTFLFSEHIAILSKLDNFSLRCQLKPTEGMVYVCIAEAFRSQKVAQEV